MSKLLKFLLFAALPMYADDPAGGGGAGDPPAPKEPETFSREYVRELREENKSWRIKHDAAVKDAETHKTAAKTAADDAKATSDSATKAANERILRAELKAAALKAGMVDLDGLKLADLSKVTLKDDGEVEGADALMEEMKKSKPYLFGTPNSSSSANNVPPPKDPKAKTASDMTPAEYKLARANIK
jgi:hypothetical protein